MWMMFIIILMIRTSQETGKALIVFDDIIADAITNKKF